MGFEHLRVYQAALELRRETDAIIGELSATKRSQLADLLKHLDESVNSVLNNIAEGNDTKYQGKKEVYLDIARCSSKEARNGFTSMIDRKGATAKRAYRAIGLTMVINKMLRSMSSE